MYFVLAVSIEFYPATNPLGRIMLSLIQTRDNLMKPIRLLLLLLFAASNNFTFAADPAGQNAATLETQVKVQMDYLLYLPKDYEKQESWPLLLFLHGSGERGDDLELVKKHGPPKLIAAGKEFPFIVEIGRAHV